MIDYDNEKRLYFEQLDLFDDMDNETDNDWTLLINDKEYKVYETDEKFDVGNNVLYTLVEHENVEYLERGWHLVNRLGYVLLDTDMGEFFPLYHGEYWDGMEEEFNNSNVGIIQSIDRTHDTIVLIDIATPDGLKQIEYDNRMFIHLLEDEPNLLGKRVKIMESEWEPEIDFLEEGEGYFG